MAMADRPSSLVLCAVLIIVALVGTAAAGPFEDGRAALGRGDYAKAFKLFEIVADQGDPRAEEIVGVMYQNGCGVSPSYAEALKWYRRAADQGFAAAQFSFGNMYADGLGVPK